MNRLRLFTVLVLSAFAVSHSSVVEAQSGIDKRFLQKTSVQADSKPVVDFLREICEKHKFPVEFDPSIAAEGLNQIPFTLTAEGLTLGSAIHLACESAGLVSFVEKGRLMVTTQTADDSNHVTHDYALNLIGPIPDLTAFTDGLTSVSSGYWKDVDGEGGEFVAITPRALSIRQSRSAHTELQSLFEQLAAATAGRARSLTVSERAEQTLLRKLQVPSPFPADDVSLPDFLNQLLKKNGVPYWVDAVALEDEGIDWTMSKVTPDVKKMPIAARLDFALSGLELSWRIADEVVQITTKAKANEFYVTRVYDVRRLISPNQSLSAIALQLQNNAELGPWAEVDGEGGSLMELRSMLIVRHTLAVHAKLAGMLK